MSNRRIKSLTADEDDLLDDYDDDDYYDDHEGAAGIEMTDEDREQMRIGTAKVRQALGPAYSKVPIKDIEDALWNYYYDVDQSVTYLKRTHKAVTAPPHKKMTTPSHKAASTPKAKAKDVDNASDDLSSPFAEVSIDPVKVKSKNINVVEEYNKTTHKKAANFVVIGHVDAGKSTLMGRLLFDLGAVDQRTIDMYKKEAESMGKGSFAFAWVLDEGTEERERGVTMDIATNKFETEKTNFTILDAPGHRDFVPNMLAGATQADFAVLVIDASTGNFESGLKGQTKEHAILVRSIGVQKIIVVVNKMDMVEWAKDRFDDIQQQAVEFLVNAGFQTTNISFVPCTGLGGGNILNKEVDKEAAWYTGPTLVELLDSSEPYSFALDQPFRMTINDKFRGGVQNPLSVSGRIEVGNLQIGETVMVVPSGETANVKALEVDDEPQEWAVAGQNVILHLAGIDPIHLKIGDVLCSPDSPVPSVTEFKAKLLSHDYIYPMTVDFHRGRLHIPAHVSKLIARLDNATGEPVKKKPKIIKPGELVRVQINLEQPIPLEALACVVLRSDGETIATGTVE